MLNVKMRPHVLLLDFITPVGKSGRGLPQSKTLRDRRGRREVRQVLDCASPLALCLCAGDGRRGKLSLDFFTLAGKAVEDYRSPRRFATAEAAEKSARFWTAPVLWRFGRALGMDDGR